jgi:peroxiredoxin Q/BCP
LKPKFDAKKATVCGVSFDTVEENRAFREKFDFPYALLCDTDKQLGIALGAAADDSAKNAKRITVVISADGLIRHVFDTVKPAEHPQEVLAAI